MNRRLCRLVASSMGAAIIAGLAGAEAAAAQAQTGVQEPVAGAVQAAVPPRHCSQVPQDTIVGAGAGAGGGFAIGGPPGAAVGAGIGTILSWVGGCHVKVSGTPHPAPGS